MKHAETCSARFPFSGCCLQECAIERKSRTLDLLLIRKKDVDKILQRRHILETQAFHQNAF
jgi:hypothetical protein